MAWMMLTKAKVIPLRIIIPQSELLLHVRLLGSETAPPPPLPEPIPKRPSRGPRNNDVYQRRTQTAPRRPTPFTKEAEDNMNMNSNSSSSLVSDEAFLDKFKLGPTPSHSNPNAPTPTPTPGSDNTAEDADEIFKKMKESGLIPNAVAMLDGLCKDGLVQDALKLFNLMREKGSIPEVVVYTAVVDAFCKSRRIPDAIRVFRKMQSHGISPNAFSYTLLLQGLSKCSGHLDDALHFSLDMLHSGHSPNVPTFVSLVDAFCRERGVQEARSFVSTLSQNGFILNKKAVSDYLDKNAPTTSSSLSQAIFGDTHSKPTLF